jgi:hypothetical protein
MILRYAPVISRPALAVPGRAAGNVRVNCYISSVPLGLHRLVTRWQCLWILLIYAVAMALALAVLKGFRAFRLHEPRIVPASGGFWPWPFHAPAAWAFSGSWATNIAAAGAATAGILTAAGAVRSLLPGIQLDRYAMLIAVCGSMVVAMPLVYGAFIGILRGSHLTVPGNASITLRRAGRGPGRCTIKVPGGANMTFPGGADREVNGQRERVLAAGASVSVPMGSAITVSGEQVALASAATAITVAAGSTIAVSKDLTVMAAGAPGPGGTGGGRVIEGGAAAGQSPIIADAGAAVTVSGVADIELLRDTELTAPHRARATLREAARLKIPAGNRAAAADLRPVIPAAAVTMFGIGAELGMAGVLGGGLAAEVFSARAIVVAVAAVLAVVTLWHAAAGTRALADSAAGPAPGADGTSYTL